MENNSLNFDFNDGVLRVTIVGEINHHSAVFVRQEIDEKIQELRPQNLVLDLADAPFIDSSGLGLIMGRYQRIEELECIKLFNAVHSLCMVINKEVNES